MPSLNLLPKQLEFLNAKERECLYSGAVRAGKSYTLCVKTAIRATVKGAREMLWRKYLADLKATTLKTLLEGDGAMPPVLPSNCYTHNKAERIIRLNGGGEIVYGGMVSGEGKDQRVGSYSATGVNIDEATEFQEHEYRMLASRASVPVPGIVNQINMATNPGSPSHWLARMFGLAPDTPACPDNRKVIRTRSSDNFFLPPDYIAYLDTTTGLWRKRYVDGLWVGSEGLVYDKWDREVHVGGRDDIRGARVVVAVDDGYTNPFVSLRISVDGDGRACVQRETYATGQLMAQRVAAVRGMVDGAEAVVVDPSAADLIAELRNANLPVIEADNAVFDGICRVQQRLVPAGDGKVRLTVDPSCRNTIREFETYEWKVGTTGTKDEPVKANDHAMDALRYAIAYLDGGVQVGASLVGAVADPTPDKPIPAHEYFAKLRADPNGGWE